MQVLKHFSQYIRQLLLTNILAKERLKFYEGSSDLLFDEPSFYLSPIVVF